MNRKLRSFLESIGLRADASDAQAWAFFNIIGGQQRADADAIVTAEQIEIPSTRSDASETESASEEADTEQTRSSEPDLNLVRRQERTRLDYINSYRGEVSEETLRRATDEGWTEEQVDVRFNREIVRSLRSQQTVEPNHRGTRGAASNSESRVLQAAFLMRFGIEPSSPSLRGDFAMRLLRSEPGLDAGWLVNGARSLESSGNLTEEADRAFERAYQRRHVSMIDICRNVLEMQGIRHSSWSNEEIIQRAASTSILSSIFSTAFNVQLIEGFMSVEDTSSMITRSTQLPNYASADRVQMGKYARLKRRVRGNEPDDGNIEAAAESLRVFEYASKFQIDEQDFVDDRFGALNQLTPQEMGEAAAELRPDLVYGLILSNPTMQDTGSLFNATAVTSAGGHANLTASSALSATTLATVRTTFDKRTLAGTANRLVRVSGRKLLVPPELRYTARGLAQSQELRDTTSNTRYATENVLKGDFEVISEPRLSVGVEYPLTGLAVSGSGTSWYLVDANARYGIEVGYLSGRGEAPRVRRLPVTSNYMMGWSVDHVIGVGAIGYEGIHKVTA